MKRSGAMLFNYLKTRVRNRLKSASADNVAIVRGMIWVTAFLTTAKLIAAGKEVLIAAHYGTSSVVDGYLFIYNLAQWPVTLFFSVTTMVVIPYLVKLQKANPTEAKKLQAAFLTLALWLGIAVSLVFFLIMFGSIHHFDFGLTLQSKSSALTALPWVGGGIAFAFMSAVISNWLMSQRRYSNTLIEATPAAAILGCLLFWPVASDQVWDVWPLAVGTFVGFLLQNLFLIRLSKPSFAFRSLGIIKQHWHNLGNAFSVMLLGQIVLSSTSILDQFFSIRMGDGVLASYSYAMRIMALVLGLTATVVGRAMLPIFSAIADVDKSYAMATRWAYRIAGLGLLGVPLIFFTAEWAVRLLFQRGAFTEDDTHEVAKILCVLALQLPFYLFSIVMVQWLGAVRRLTWLLLGSIVSFLAKLSGVLLWYDHKGLGLAASTSLMYAFTSIVIYSASRITHKSLVRTSLIK